jgi:hypothetical protein
MLPVQKLIGYTLAASPTVCRGTQQKVRGWIETLVITVASNGIFYDISITDSCAQSIQAMNTMKDERYAIHGAFQVIFL